MAPSACLSLVVTLALLLLITGFALGGQHKLSKKRHHRHSTIARFLPHANHSAVSSLQLWYNVVMPVVLVSTLSSVMLALPVGCGERLSVSVTTFLTLAVFMTLVQDNLPNNSDTVCYLGIYLASQMILGAMAIIVFAAVVTRHYSHNDAGFDSETARVLSGVAKDFKLAMADKNLATSAANATSADGKRSAVKTECLGEKFVFPLFVVLSVLSLLLYVLAVVS